MYLSLEICLIIFRGVTGDTVAAGLQTCRKRQLTEPDGCGLVPVASLETCDE